jgi:hypothetical protein
VRHRGVHGFELVDGSLERESPLGHAGLERGAQPVDLVFGALERLRSSILLAPHLRPRRGSPVPASITEG